MSGLGIVIVTHNSEAVIGPCLDAARAVRGEIVVVDNASADGTIWEVLERPGVRLLANPWNRGFASAANQGIQTLDCPYALLLNPDTELIGGVEGLVEACRQHRAAAAGGKLIDSRGRAQTGFLLRRFPSPLTLIFEVLGVNRLWRRNPVNRRYRCLDADLDTAARVEQPAGAFLLIQRDAWRQLGGFDESFHPLWFEDVDFCKRAVDQGYQIRYVPSAAARHQGGHSAGQLPPGARELYWYGNLLRYASKHFRRAAFLAVCTAVMLGSCFRTILGIFRWRSPRIGPIYGRVIRLAAWYSFSGQRERPRLSSAFAGR